MTNNDQNSEPSKDDIEKELQAKIEQEVEKRMSADVDAGADKKDLSAEDKAMRDEIASDIDKKVDEKVGEKPKRKRKKTSQNVRKSGGMRKDFQDLASGGRPKLSEKEMKIREEKAKIDAKFKKQLFIIYPAITVIFIIAAMLLFVFKGTIQGWFYGDEKKSNKTNDNIERVSTGEKNKVTKSNPTGVSNARFANTQTQAEELVKQGKYQAAYDLYDAHVDEHIKDAEMCGKAQKELISRFKSNGAHSAGLKAVLAEVEKLKSKGTPEAVQEAANRIADFGNNNADERFICDVYFSEIESVYYGIDLGEDVDKPGFNDTRNY